MRTPERTICPTQSSPPQNVLSNDVFDLVVDQSHVVIDLSLERKDSGSNMTLQKSIKFSNIFFF